MKAKKILALVMAGALLLGALAGCGGSGESSTASTAGESKQESSSAGGTETAKSDA